MSKKQRILRNRIIAGVITLLSGYVLIINNSLDFLIKFGINVNQNVVAFIGFIIIAFWVVWKANIGEI